MDFDFDFPDIPDSIDWDSFQEALNKLSDSGFHLSESDVANSVSEASAFFNIGVPFDIHEDWTTGVMNLNPTTELDDILVYNRQQMSEMGISDKESFDLVMTHECAHRALQGLNKGYSPHQEELCCDYMAGVRAGLNGVDETLFVNSLQDTSESLSHPEGEARVTAIRDGIAFAQDFMSIHNGTPPRFSDCLDHFENSDTFRSSYSQLEGFVTLTPEDGDISDPAEPPTLSGYTQHDVDWYEKQARISSGTEQEHWLRQAQWAKDHLHGYTEIPEEMNHAQEGETLGNLTFKGYSESEIKSKVENAEAKIRYAQSQIRNHSELLKTSNYPETEKMHIKHAERDLAAAKAELNKWKSTKPSA